MTPLELIQHMAKLAREGECIEHLHDPSMCSQECCTDKCTTYWPGNDEDVDVLYSLIQSARDSLEPVAGDKEYWQAARNEYGAEGHIEIDDGAQVSRAHEHGPDTPCHSADEDGAYVQAWVWVERTTQ